MMQPASGLFWLPETPDVRVPGRLRLSDDGSPEVELFGHIAPSMKIVSHDPATGTTTLEPADDPPSFTVHGFVDPAPRAVSLFRCYTPTRSEVSFVATPLERQTVRATFVLRGDSHVANEEELFSAVAEPLCQLS